MMFVCLSFLFADEGDGLWSNYGRAKGRTTTASHCLAWFGNNPSRSKSREGRESGGGVAVFPRNSSRDVGRRHEVHKHTTQLVAITTHSPQREQTSSPPHTNMTLIVDFPSRRRHTAPQAAPTSTPAPEEDVEQEPKQQRRVSFLNVSQMKVVPDIATEDAMPDLYYTRREIQAIKRGNCRMLMAIRASGVTMTEFAQRHVSKTELFMGLEAHLDVSISNEMRMRRYQQSRSVLEEQSRQLIRSGFIDHTELARVSARESEWARVRARIIGQIHDDRPGEV